MFQKKVAVETKLVSGTFAKLSFLIGTSDTHSFKSNVYSDMWNADVTPAPDVVCIDLALCPRVLSVLSRLEDDFASIEEEAVTHFVWLLCCGLMILTVIRKLDVIAKNIWLNSSEGKSAE